MPNIIKIGSVSHSCYLLGPFYEAIAVPSVTRCRSCRCGHRFYIAIHQVSLLSHAACAIYSYSYSWLRLILVVVSTVATPGEWQCKIRTGGVRRLAVANGPNIFQMLIVRKRNKVASLFSAMYICYEYDVCLSVCFLSLVDCNQIVRQKVEVGARQIGRCFGYLRA